MIDMQALIQLISSFYGIHIMPRIGKNTAVDNSSEIIDHIDSHSSSASFSESSQGSGDEGITIPGTTTPVTTTPPSIEPTPGLLSSPLKTIIGTFCALTAVVGSVLVIYGGNALNNPEDSQGLMHHTMLGISAAMLGVGSMLAVGICVDNTTTSS